MLMMQVRSWLPISPQRGSVRNLQKNSAACLSFVDVFRQKGYKLTGKARIAARDDPEFERLSAPLTAIAGNRFKVRHVIALTVERIAPILAPSYALYHATEEDMIEDSYRTYSVAPISESWIRRGCPATPADSGGIADSMTTSTHTVQMDERNRHIRININGELFPREKAVVSVFDSGFVLGDGIWEGLRLHQGVIPFLDRHLKRLWEGARALDFDLGISPAALKTRLYDTMDANGMESGVHIRLMLSRGVKSTPYQDPAMTVGEPTIVIIPEHKTPDPGLYDRGVRLYTVYVRRGYADVQDPRINSHSKLNCIFGCIQAAKAGYDEALMLDPHGHVATCNSTHFFIVREGEVWTSSGDYCLDGITRRNIINLCKANDLPVYERNFSVAQAYGAEEAFVTGTFAGVTPVSEIDGRIIGAGKPGPMTRRLRKFYQELIKTECDRGRQ